MLEPYPPVPGTPNLGKTETLLGLGRVPFFKLKVRFTGTVPPSIPLVGLVLTLRRFSIARASAV